MSFLRLLLTENFSCTKLHETSCIKQQMIANLNYFTTQSGRSHDPNLGRNSVFADPCGRFR